MPFKVTSNSIWQPNENYDFEWPDTNPWTELLRNDSLCFSDKSIELTYNQVADKVEAYRKRFVELGVKSTHRIALVADNSAEAWVFMIAGKGYCSIGGISHKATAREHEVRIKNSNSNWVAYVTNNKLTDFRQVHDEPSTTSQYECTWWTGSGTGGCGGTDESDHVQISPINWYVGPARPGDGDPDNLNVGNSNIPSASWRYSYLLFQSLGREVCGSRATEQMVTINASSPYVSTSEDVVTANYLCGGHSHMIQKPSEYGPASFKYKPIYMAQFISTYQMILEQNEEMDKNLHQIHLIGGTTTKKLRDALRERLGVKLMVNCYGTAEFFVTIDSWDPETKTSKNPGLLGSPINYPDWLNVNTWVDEETGMIQTQGTHTGGVVCDTHDYVEVMPNGQWKFAGRAHTSFVHKNGGKIIVDEVERIIVDELDEHKCYGFAAHTNDIAIDDFHVTYSGDPEPEVLHKRLTEVLQSYQVPTVYWHLHGPFKDDTLPGYSGKITRRLLLDHLSNNPQIVKSVFKPSDHFSQNS